MNENLGKEGKEREGEKDSVDVICNKDEDDPTNSGLIQPCEKIRQEGGENVASKKELEKENIDVELWDFNHRDLGESKEIKCGDVEVSNCKEYSSKYRMLGLCPTPYGYGALRQNFPIPRDDEKTTTTPDVTIADNPRNGDEIRIIMRWERADIVTFAEI